MTVSLSQVLIISRPRFWLYLVGPYMIGYICGMSTIEKLFYLQFWMFFLYFLIPSNIFLYGINDLYDEDTDTYNDKKGEYEYKITNSQKRILYQIVGICFFITASFVLLANNILISIFLVLFLFLSYSYSAHPFRWKAKPYIDSLSNILYIIPGIIGYLLANNSFPGLSVLISASLWTIAMHLFSAIPDISADQKAKLKTSAVILGKTKSLLVCSALWFAFAYTLVITIPILWLYLGFLYSLIPLIILTTHIPVEKVYRYFPLINTVMGFIIFWIIIIMRFYPI